jgi:hypothetical protein
MLGAYFSNDRNHYYRIALKQAFRYLQKIPCFVDFLEGIHLGVDPQVQQEVVRNHRDVLRIRQENPEDFSKLGVAVGDAPVVAERVEQA